MIEFKQTKFKRFSSYLTGSSGHDLHLHNQSQANNLKYI